MSWGKSVEKSKPLCQESSLNIVKISGIPKICTNLYEIEMLVENNGNGNILGLKAVIIGNNNIESSEINVNIPVGEVVKVNLPYDSQKNGKIEKVKLIPNVKIDSSKKLCPKEAFEIESISEC